MDITALKAFFMWCTIINVGLLLFSSFVCIFFGDFSYRINSRCFSISRQEFNIICYSFIGLYELFVLTFNLVPYIALLIVG
jgi:hypothetical protein